MVPRVTPLRLGGSSRCGRFWEDAEDSVCSDAAKCFGLCTRRFEVKVDEKQTRKASLRAPATATTKVEINDRQSRTPLPSPRPASAASAPAMSSTATTTLIIVQQSPPLAVCSSCGACPPRRKDAGLMQANKHHLPSAALLVLAHPFFAIGAEQLHPARARFVQ